MKIQGITTYGIETEPKKTPAVSEDVQELLEKAESTPAAAQYDTYEVSRSGSDEYTGMIYDAAFLQSLGFQIPDAQHVRVWGDPKQLEALQKEYVTQKSFEQNSGQQWKIFSDQLEKSGFYEGMSMEERSQFDQRLRQITAAMDSFWQYEDRFGGENQNNIYAQVMNKNDLGAVSYRDWFYMSKEQWKGQLDQAKKDLEDFCASYLSDEQKNDFSHLIDQFYEHSEEVLKDYHALGEDPVKSMLFEAMQQKDSFEELAGDLERLLSDFLQQMAEQEEQNLRAPSEEKKVQTYLDVLKAFFTQVASSQGVSTASLPQSSDDGRGILKKLDQEMWREEQVQRIQTYYDSIVKICKNAPKKSETDPAPKAEPTRPDGL